MSLNYLRHITETNVERPTAPVIFMKAPDSVVGPNDDIVIRPGSTATDYEVEFVIVIGKFNVWVNGLRENLSQHLIPSDPAL